MREIWSFLSSGGMITKYPPNVVLAMNYLGKRGLYSQSYGGLNKFEVRKIGILARELKRKSWIREKSDLFEYAQERIDHTAYSGASPDSPSRNFLRFGNREISVRHESIFNSSNEDLCTCFNSGRESFLSMDVCHMQAEEVKYECVHFCRRRVNPMTASREDRKGQFRTIYEELNRDFRIYIKDLAKVLMIDRDTASRRLKEALTEGIITSPQLRKRSYANFKEYAYFVKCENPLPLFKQYKEDEDVVYHAIMSGFADLWIISKKKIDIKGVIAEGLRSDYHVAYAPNRSWGKAIQTMWEMIENFNPKTFKPKGIIETHWDETLEWWDAQFEALYGQFKFNGRRKFSPVMRECHVSSDKIYGFLENLPECCTIITRYFPNNISAYDPYLFMFETDYEDFIIELFSELPTSSFFFNVSDKLVMYAHIDRSSVRGIGLDMSDISELHVQLIIDNLLRKGILKKGVHAIVEYSWSKNL